MTVAAPVDPLRWKRLRDLLDRALDLEPADRSYFVASLAAGDEELRADLTRLLVEHARNESERSLDPVKLAAELLVDSHEAVDADESARVGQSVGAFRLLRLIGTGGMGAVYLAERKVDNLVHRVALKVVRGEGVSAATRERFERERQILASLAHRTSAFCSKAVRPTMASRTTRWNTSTASRSPTTAAREASASATACNCLIDVASALSHAHQTLIVHRDIKPSNVLVTGTDV